MSDMVYDFSKSPKALIIPKSWLNQEKHHNYIRTYCLSWPKPNILPYMSLPSKSSFLSWYLYLQKRVLVSQCICWCFVLKLCTKVTKIISIILNTFYLKYFDNYFEINVLSWDWNNFTEYLLVKQLPCHCWTMSDS
jgi:hypothetical protein